MNYKCLEGLTPDGTLYSHNYMGTVEALIPYGSYQTAHAPALLELPNGDLICAWFAGSFEGSADISIVCSRLLKGNDTWEAPSKISNDPERSEQNPSLFLGPDKAVWCIYTAQCDRKEGKDNMQFTSIIRVSKSFDGGKTWNDPEVLFHREGSFCRQPIQVLKNGRWIFSNWICTDEKEGLSGDPTVFQISDDEGKTWRTVSMPDSRGRVHANVVELSDGHLIAFMRSRQADFIYRSHSYNWGESFTAPVPTVLPNNNSSISALRLKSGRIAIAYNPSSAPEPDKVGAVWPGLRCPIAVALSEDEGVSWPMIRNMEPGEGFIGTENRTNNSQFEYPYLMQARDGMMHLAYAYKNRIGIKYMCFHEKDIMGDKREAKGLYNPTAGNMK